MNIIDTYMSSYYGVAIFGTLVMVVIFWFLIRPSIFKVKKSNPLLQIDKKAAIYFSIFILASIGFMWYTAISNFMSITYYKATIDDTVSFNYMYANYEVESYDDGVYTLTKKD